MADFNPYQKIVDQIIAQIDQGVLPWQMPWKSALPQSERGRIYRGLNLFVLGFKPFTDPRWLTFKRAKELGGNVKQGERGTTVYFWQWIKDTDANGVTVNKYPMLRTYTVFNVEQCEGLNIKEMDLIQCDGTPIERAEKVVANLPWKLQINDGREAFWSPAMPDAITIPNAKTFQNMDAYYSVLFHEIAHATGHESRLNRDMSNRFGSEKYGFEELVAQFTAAMVCAHCGIDNTTEADAAYVANWSKVLKGDPKMIFKAAGLAQHAADFILGTTFAEAENEEPATVAA